MGDRLPEPETPPEEVRRTVREVLDGPEFQEEDRGVVGDAADWVSERIDDFLEALFGGGAEGGGWVGVLVFGLALAGIGYLVYRYLRRVRSEPAAEPEEVELAVDRTPGDWQAQAERLEAQGRWRDALRCRYRALVAELVERDLVPDVPGRTAGEYRRDVAEHVPRVAEDFDGVTDLFELAWYAHAPTGREESHRVRTLSDRVLAGAGR